MEETKEEISEVLVLVLVLFLVLLFVLVSKIDLLWKYLCLIGGGKWEYLKKDKGDD